MFKASDMRGAQSFQLQLGFGLLVLLSACSASTPRGDGDEAAGRSGSASGSGARSGSRGGAGGSVMRDPTRCIEGRADASRLTPRVTFVLDGSCSMSTNYPANGQESASECQDNPNGRWAALRRALVDPMVGVVPRLQHAVQFGAVVYGTERRCPIPGQPVQPVINNLAAIDRALPRVQPGMFTPTGAALDYVYENLITTGGPDDENSRQIVILATDGEPNSCGGGGGGRGNMGGMMTNYQPSLDALMKGAQKGVTTFVISLADATGGFHDHLQQLANLGNPSAGGNAKLYEPTSPAELSDQLSSLISGAVSCDIAVSGNIVPGRECAGTVLLNGAPLGCNQADGWVLVDERHIRVQGAACQAMMDKTAVIDARFPCDAFSPD